VFLYSTLEEGVCPARKVYGIAAVKR